jgi:quinol monooxygenase YgiN
VIQTVLKIKVSQYQLKMLTEALKSLMISAQAERGMLECKLYQQVGNETALCYVEDWQSAVDLEQQINSKRYSQLLALMEAAVEKPSLEFHTVSETQGLDYLQAVRNGVRQIKGKKHATN